MARPHSNTAPTGAAPPLHVAHRSGLGDLASSANWGRSAPPPSGIFKVTSGQSDRALAANRGAVPLPPATGPWTPLGPAPRPGLLATVARASPTAPAGFLRRRVGHQRRAHGPFARRRNAIPTTNDGRPPMSMQASDRRANGLCRVRRRGKSKCSKPFSIPASTWPRPPDCRARSPSAAVPRRPVAIHV